MLTDWRPLTEWRTVPKIAGVYVIRHRASRKLYVGTSQDIRRRLAEHSRAGGKHYLHRALRAHGVSAFVFCVAAVGTADEMLRLEVEMIAELGTFAPAGYNATLGGEGAPGTVWTSEMRTAAAARGKLTMTPEMKEKLKVARPAINGWKGKKHSPENLAKMSAASSKNNLGRTYSAETLAKMSRSHMGVTPGPETRARMSAAQLARKFEHPASLAVACWVPDSLTPMTFPSLLHAARAMGLASHNAIKARCEGQSRAKDGSVWHYL